jgi:hypothetical protein
MADARDLHQIEYRHHPTRDFSPSASSLSSAEALRPWDSLIRSWVRHPHADRLSESVCYQVFPDELAALAWRYWDQRAAGRADGGRGRPLVSRVLVGPTSVLAPEAAVALCQTGPTADLVGPLPGEVPGDAVLPIVSGAALSAMTRAMTPVLDQDAARQDGLQAVVAAALANPLTPLAISVRDDLILRPLPEGVQYPLVWGLRRIAGPLFGWAGRGWSFSTFEPPLGEMDPASLPGIVFRQVQDGAQTQPARWRKEAKVRPFDLDALDLGSPYAAWVELAGWLVTAFQDRGGDDMDQFITECCDGEQSPQVRLERVHDGLRNIQPPTLVVREPSASAAPFAHWEPAPQGRQSVQPDLAEHERGGADTDETALCAPSPAAGTVADEPSPPETAEPAVPWQTSFEPIPVQQGEARSMTDQVARNQSPEQFVPVSDLLKLLELVRDDSGQFDSTLRRISQAGGQSDDPHDRARSWEVISHNDWYENICKNRTFDMERLAEIFGIVVIPELAGPDASGVIARWAYGAPPRMIGGLLAAARKRSPETWHAVIRILEPGLAARWAAESLIQGMWDDSRVRRSAAELGRGDNRRGLLGRLRRH